MMKRKLSISQRAMRAVVYVVAMMATTPTIAACPFSDGNWDLTHDGLVLSRYASALSGPPLVANTRFASADPAIVKRDLDHLRGPLDVNGDAQITSVTARSLPATWRAFATRR